MANCRAIFHRCQIKIIVDVLCALSPVVLKKEKVVEACTKENKDEDSDVNCGEYRLTVKATIASVQLLKGNTKPVYQFKRWSVPLKLIGFIVWMSKTEFTCN